MDGDAARYLLEWCPLKGTYANFFFSNDKILGWFFFLKIGISSIIHAFFLYNNDVFLQAGVLKSNMKRNMLKHESSFAFQILIISLEQSTSQIVSPSENSN